jgi:hypothetical protein
LTLYTDGLVEHRGSDIDVGIDHLRTVLDETRLPIEALPGVLASALLADEPDDDVAIQRRRRAPSDKGATRSRIHRSRCGLGRVARRQ